MTIVPTDHSNNRTKLDPRTFKCVLLEYSRGQKGYRFYYLTLYKFVTFAHFTFFESTPYYTKKSSKSTLYELEDNFIIFLENSLS